MSEKDKFKFSSSFLKKPFTSNNNPSKSDLVKEELTPNKEEIVEDIENENTSKISSKINKNDITYSISELQRPQTSLFNHENSSNKMPNNLSISTSTMNSKKRKPFENLTFYSEKKNFFNNENKEEKDDQSIMSDIQFKNIDINNPNNPLKESLTEFNASQITENEKSMIISSYKLISKETIEKAKKLNKQYKETPFWIKFFEEIENDTLKNNSSYFKINNKNEYIKNLVTMIQRDADLYDKLQKSKEIKQETENEIKKFIQDNNMASNIINGENNKNNNVIISDTSNNSNNNSSRIKRHNSSKISVSKNTIDNNNNSTNNNINQTEKKTDKNDINDKFSKILESYNKLDEKERKLFFNEEDYESFKFKLITGGKFNTEKEKEIEKIPVMIKKLENLEDINEKPMTEKEKNLDKIQKIKGIKEFKTIDMLYFGDNYTFEELNYNKIDFYAFNKESLPKILALDRRLHEIDPERYKTSINTELKKIQDEFNAGKEERMLKVGKEISDKFYKYMEDTKETRKTIFDIKPKNDSKIKYTDYLHYKDDIKKERKELMAKLNKLDDKIKQININSNKELSQEQISKINQELDNYHSSEEFKQKYEAMNVPGVSLLNRLQKDMKQFETNNKELEQGLIETKKLVEEQEKKKSKEEKEKYYKEIVEPFLEHEKEVDKFEEDNKIDNDKVRQLEEEMKKEEELLNNIQNNLDELNQNKNKYEEMFEEADKIIMENNPSNNNEELEEIDFIKKYEVEKIVEEQKENEKLIGELDKQMQIFEEKLQNIKKSNENVEKELKEMKFMTPEEFCKVPDDLMKLLKEIEEDKNNDKEEKIEEEKVKENNEEFEEDSLEDNNKPEDNDKNKENDINNINIINEIDNKSEEKSEQNENDNKKNESTTENENN